MQRGLAPVLDALRERIGPQALRVDAETLARYGTDRTTRWAAAPGAVVFPRSVAELQLIVALARAHRLPLVPSGGRTGLSGGAVAADGELVVAMERMDRVLDFDPADRMLTVEAGMLTARVQAAAVEHGLYYPVDFASAGSSQIGGNVATNAGGIRVIRHGMTRRQVTGLRVVDGRGELLSFNNGLLKNNAGPDLGQLFIGSEGTLGIIAAVTLQLQSPPPPSSVLLLGVRRFADIPPLLARFRARLALSAFEFFAHNALQRVLAQGGQPAPLAQPAPFYVLLEHDLRNEQDRDRALALFAQCVEDGLVSDGVQAASEAQARALWRCREDISEALARWQPWKNDISVRPSRMGEFIERVEALAAREYRGLELVWYGHIGDGNLHLNVLKPDAMAPDEFAQRCVPAAAQVAELVHDFGGSISAEHGIGLLKRDYLGATLGPAVIERLRELKAVFDPDGIMNPGKLLPSILVN